ncbi:LOW QUALITY PROTEIN: hypothetical protein M8C21_006210, partial [Ambrosia artemisiifolia]
VDATRETRHGHGSRLLKETFYLRYGDYPKNTSTTFNVLSFGAKGDGTTDNTKAFEAAWLAACKLETSTMIVPNGLVFLIKPISFSGSNYESNNVFQWQDYSSKKILKLEVWTPSMAGVYKAQRDNDMWNRKSSGTKPTTVRFYGSSDVTVMGITIQNSQQTHLKFDNCKSVQVFDVTISSLGDSPNTDGIHLQNSHDVTIHSTILACGDDCVSIQTGCSGVNIHNVDCGSGHGISIGSLGKHNTKSCIHDTNNGVRIKTWQGGYGLVQGATFSNIEVSKVQNSNRN